MQIQVVSFGFKHGVPLDADTVFDCRFLPNPHWVDELRPLTGLDDAGAGLRAGPAEGGRVPRPGWTICSVLVLPAYVKEGKSYLTIGGRVHRRPAPFGGRSPRS